MSWTQLGQGYFKEESLTEAMKIKDIFRKHKRELTKAYKTGDLSFSSPAGKKAEDDLMQWALNNGEVKTDDPDDFFDWLSQDLEDIVKGKIKENKLDPVGKGDDDIDNDGDSDDSDKYLKKRRAAISKAMEKESVNESMMDINKFDTLSDKDKENLKKAKKEYDTAWSGVFVPMGKDGTSQRKFYEKQGQKFKDASAKYKTLLKKLKVYKEDMDVNEGLELRKLIPNLFEGRTNSAADINRDAKEGRTSGGFALVFSDDKDRMNAFKEVERFAKKNKIPKSNKSNPTDAGDAGYGMTIDKGTGASKGKMRVWVFNNTKHKNYADTSELFKKVAKMNSDVEGKVTIGKDYGTF